MESEIEQAARRRASKLNRTVWWLWIAAILVSAVTFMLWPTKIWVAVLAGVALIFIMVGVAERARSLAQSLDDKDSSSLEKALKKPLIPLIWRAL